MNTINWVASECILHVNERGWLRIYKVAQQVTGEAVAQQLERERIGGSVGVV